MSELINVRNWLSVSCIGANSIFKLISVLPLAPVRIKLPFLKGNKHLFWSQVSCFEINGRHRLSYGTLVSDKYTAWLGILKSPSSIEVGPDIQFFVCKVRRISDLEMALVSITRGPLLSPWNICDVSGRATQLILKLVAMG